MTNAVFLTTDAAYLPIAWTVARQAASEPGRDFDVWLLTAPGLACPAPPGCRVMEITLPTALHGWPRPPHMSEFAYARLAAPDLWLKTYDKLLYIDSDTRITGALSPLFALDMGDALVAMAEDCGRYLGGPESSGRHDWDNYCRTLGLDPAGPYFNSGVVLFNANAWQEEKLWPRLQDFIATRGKNLTFMDQDALNSLCAGRIAELSARWNFQTHYFALGLEGTVNPVIRHYANILKPWRDPEWTTLYGLDDPRAFAALFADSPWPGYMPKGLTQSGLFSSFRARRSARAARRFTEIEATRHVANFTAMAPRLKQEIPPGIGAARARSLA